MSEQDIYRELGRLSEAQEQTEKAIEKMAGSMDQMAVAIQSLAESQAAHNANASQILENREDIHNLEKKCETVSAEVVLNTQFRKGFMWVFLRVLTPVIGVASLGLTVAAFSGLFE